MSKFKVGDRVKINDKYPLDNPNPSGRDRESRGKEGTYEGRSPGGCFLVVNLGEHNPIFYVKEEELTLVNKFKVGDKVRVTIQDKDVFWHGLGVGTVGIIREISSKGNYYVKPNCECGQYVPGEQLELVVDNGRKKEYNTEMKSVRVTTETIETKKLADSFKVSDSFATVHVKKHSEWGRPAVKLSIMRGSKTPEFTPEDSQYFYANDLRELARECEAMAEYLEEK